MMMERTRLREMFLLEDDVHFLNHGSFGACPGPVFEEYQRIQLELERQPVRFLGREFRERMAGARTELAAYLGADADDLTYVPNTTTGLNIVARSLRLNPGDEVLGTDHEYGALDRMWSYICEKSDAHYVRAPIAVPLTSPDDIVEQVWSHVNARTRVLFISHITSSTAVILPIEALIARARDAGIFTVIDGAHAPGMIPVNLDALGADAYSGNCHKWMLAPKGSGFLHVRKDTQHLIDPLIVSWGWKSDEPSSSQFVDYTEWQGTRDISAFLTVPAAIRFMEEHDWPTVAQRCSDLLHEYVPQILAATGQPALAANSPDWFTQMSSFVIPTSDWQGLKTQLYDDYRIEAPTIWWNNKTLLRISVNAYSSADDLELVAEALEAICR
ncbi:aminotransferase class V-fold PLP-dependent enzyme [Candidatus Bipolaricaulota bacterium]|nr:aminotransferase class V-fold PLP-dependent enzyme [Candidatus Bipolaricaulota bacterium]